MNAVVSFPDAETGIDPATLSAALEACPESLAVVEHSRVVYANSAFAGLFGYTANSEILNHSLAELLAEDRLCAHLGSEDIAVSDRTACGYPGCRFEGRRRDGTLLAMEASCQRFHSQGHHYLIMTARDVSQPERRRLVRESERRFRSIFDASALGIAHCTLEARIVESNGALERMLGYDHAELRGMHFQDFLHPEDLSGGLERFAEMVSGEREHYQLELRYRRKDRSQGSARLTVSLVRGPDQRPEFAIVMVEDVTQQKQAEQQLRDAQKMEAIGRLVGGVAHDFNNLLTGIMLYCDLLMGGLKNDSRLYHHAEEIRLASEHGAALIRQLLAVARQQVVEPRVLCLNEVVAAMRNLLARLIGENVELVADLSPDLGSVRIDPTQAQQIILNLVLNARDAMPQGGRVTLQTRNCSKADRRAGGRGGTSNWVQFSVVDDGCGMQPDVAARLFEPFFTTKPPGKGNGLGLITVQNAVKQCGGSIRVESEPGTGTSVIILLPIVEAGANSPLPPPVSSASGPETVLVVEDDTAVRRSMQRLLTDHGYTVLLAENGSEALNICRSRAGRIHLLLADMVLPGMNGQQVAQQARLLRPDMQVLYASGYSHTSATETGGCEPLVIFRKPFTGTELLNKVRETLGSSPIQRSKRKKRSKP